MHKIISYFKSTVRPYENYLSKSFILGIDVILVLLSYYSAMLFISNFSFAKMNYFFAWPTLLLVTLRILAFIYFRTYQIIMRHIGESDLKNIFYAAFSSSAVFFLLKFFFFWEYGPRNFMALALIDFLLLLSASIGIRLFLRQVYDHIKMKNKSVINVAIFGAGEMGALTEKIFRHGTTNSYKVVAFFDDQPKLQRKYLNGIRVFNPRSSFEEVIKKYDVKVAIIAINYLNDKRRISFINKCLEHQVKVLKTPPVESWINNTIDIGQLRDINFEDLLNRPAIQLDETRINEGINGKKILVTGCAGSIGSEIVRQLLQYKPGLIVGFDQAETPLAEVKLALKDYRVFKGVIGDIKDYEKLYQLFQQYNFDHVFHAAAYKHVPVMEEFPEESVKVNILGTKNVADLASAFRVKKFVMISTDKVVNPGNVMGASKRIAEIYVQALNFRSDNKTQFITTRFGNVLGSNGSVIPIFKAQIERREDITVTHPDVTRFFMTIPEACQLVLEAGAIGNGGEIFVFDMGEPVSIVSLAEKLIHMAGLVPGRDIKIVFTGLRPGEKMTEELLDEQEGVIPTHHPKIRKATVRTASYNEITRLITDLEALVNTGAPSYVVVQLMKQIVPEYVSQNEAYARPSDSARAN
jgi:FlaA1/EpsC-like NDP-sugar epimerase